MAEPDKQGRLTFFPFAYALLADELVNYCWYCLGESGQLKKCLGCGVAAFCNRDCQVLGWKDHKAECVGFKHTRAIPCIETRMLGRLVIRYKDILSGKDKKDKDFYKDRTSTRSIMDIWAHTDKMKADPYAMKKFEDVYSKLIQFYDEKYMLSKETVFELHCRDYINRHAISDYAYIKEIGKGLYLDLCAYDHSCRPNTIYSCKGFVATLRALNSNVDIHNKQTTFYSYIELVCNQQERKKQLKDTWYFDCLCDRCVDPQDHVLTSVLCQNCKSSKETRVFIFGNPEYKDKTTGLITCPECHVQLPQVYVVECIKLMKFVDKVISDKEIDQMPQKMRISFLYDLVERMSNMFPVVNVYLCRIVQQLLGQVHDNTNELLRLHLMVEEFVRHCFPHKHPALGFHLRNIGVFYESEGNKELAVKYLSESQSILEFTLDADHPMSVENRSLLDEAKGSIKITEEVEKITLACDKQEVVAEIVQKDTSPEKPIEKIEDEIPRQNLSPCAGQKVKDVLEHHLDAKSLSDMLSDTLDDLPELIE